ncbi:HpcH/HpaI aldolase/citrate lyase family protein [Cytobacillus purgationiresistens]|uniref:Citrate lyase subunit beta/citryl-CoA lyase n=1 Tax=Cytobacillus purgationiresistens TaxID=863449 RepID=A0ABU0AEL3_9BACI|nr:CoA ester lyase [Cytobacillus purgationiresistens]MDQ0269694.1 citrate lyase subunit beta/citryl-CoA lyase [Cytobacillus purgationiresistens]
MKKCSYLFVPGISKSMMEKAVKSDAGYVILDLEDSVAVSAKIKARKEVKKCLINLNDLSNIFIRINDSSTIYWKEDIDLAINTDVQGIVLPKAESEQQLKKVCNYIEYNLHLTGRNRTDFEVIPLIESAKGIHFAYEIGRSHPFVSRMAFGSIDFSHDIGITLSSEGTELIYARSQIVNASRAAGIQSPIDAVFSNINDKDGLMKEAERGKQYGFKAKLAIHPKQLETIHHIFQPSQKEVMEAKEIVASFEAAEVRGLASIQVNERLVDYPVYKKAKALLE